MAQVQTPQVMPDAIEAGRVLAELNDWRAILFVLLFIIVTQFIFIMWREWAMNHERKRIDRLAERFALSSDRMADNMGKLSTKIAVLAALTARAESMIATASKEDSNGEG